LNKPRSDLSFANERLFYLALVLAVTPLWLTHYLPGVDLPGQAAQAAALHEIWRGNPTFTELFEINPFTPYMTATLLLALLSYAMPVSVATKLLVSAVIVATPILSGRLLDAVGGDARWRWLLIPSTYSFAFYWGFFPYLTAVPLGLVLLLLTVRLQQKPSVGLGTLIAAYSVFLFFSHLLVLCFSSLLALAWLTGCNYRRLPRLAALCIPYTATLPLIAGWLFKTVTSGSYTSDDRILFGSLPKRLLDIPVQATGMDGSFFWISILVFAVIVVMPFATGMRLTKKPQRWLLAVCGVATFMLFPTFGMGTAFLYDRFGLYLPLMWFVLWEKTAQDSPRWHWLGMLAVFIWAGANLLRFSAFNIETRGFDTLLAKMEPGKRSVSMVTTHSSSQFTAPVFLHFPSWYQAERRGVVDFNFGMFYGTMVRYRPGKRPQYGDALAWNPAAFDWQKNGGDNYDYFIIRSRTDVSAEIFKNYRSSVELLGNADWWWLYRRKDSGSKELVN